MYDSHIGAVDQREALTREFRVAVEYRLYNIPVLYLNEPNMHKETGYLPL